MADRALLTVCSIGSTDPWNAAGLGLDIRALAECGVRPVTVVAGVTAQDRSGIGARHVVPVEIVAAQLRSLREAKIAAYRIGALLSADAIRVVALHVAGAGVPVVYDPVLAASGGGEFLDEAGLRSILQDLVPHATLLTPNLAEAARLTGAESIDDVEGMERAGAALCARGAAAVLVKGGHLRDAAVDLLVAGGETVVFESPRLPGSLRGTGCLLACAAAAALARGEPLRDAIEFARAFVRTKFAGSHRAGGMDVAY